jgi:hypothetical protein
MLKKCNKCETEKEIVNFHKKSSSKENISRLNIKLNILKKVKRKDQGPDKN